MGGKVTFEVTRGALAGQKFEYGEKTRIFIGRQEDCGIVLPESTVSRYHCVLEITPPEVKLQDFYSLNGTYLNGTKIGQRDREQSLEAAREAGKDEQPDEHVLHSGDVLGLGNKCELRCLIECAEVCAECGAELPDGISGGETVPDDEERAPMHYNAGGKRICEDCYLKGEKAKLDKRAKDLAAQQAAAAAAAAQQAADHAAQQAAQAAADQAEAERIEAERLAAQLAAEIAANKPQRKKCAACGKAFTPTAPDNDLCPDCLTDRAKVLDGILKLMLGTPEKEREEPAGPSPVQGYQKIKQLGEGGMGEVWKVQETGSGKYYALKTMLPQVKADKRAIQMFLREAAIGEALGHKNVVKTYRSGCANGTFYILMDLCEGGSVDDLMTKKGGRLSMELATWITLQVLTGLDYVHNVDIGVAIQKGVFGGTREVSAKGVVHRDFKPGNIFLSDNSDKPIAMVADLGMAKAFELAGLSRISKTGAKMGTPVFMPRQQAIDAKYAKPEVDVWAAAASYYNMLTGELPKNFGSGRNVWQVLLTEPAVPIRDRNSAIPQSVAAVIDKALRENPSIGYQTASAFRKELVAALPSNVKNAVKEVI